MLRGLLDRIPSLLKRWREALPRRAETPAPLILPAPARRRLERVVVAEGVMRTLFDDFAEHRRTPRGEEEIGWVLLGHWQDGVATALAALPAGAERDASVGHIQFHSDAQAIASLFLRQNDKRLRVIGIVHTHPGDMRYPSSGDLHGDSRWVRQLRSGEAVFGIGTADGNDDDTDLHGDVCFTWYALGVGDQRYRPVPVQVTTDGVDLALPLRPIWRTMEAHAHGLNRLCRQFTQVRFESIDEGPSKLLAVHIGLAEPNQQLRLLLSEREARYYWENGGELVAIDPQVTQLDRAVYLILAELAGRTNDSPVLVES